MWTRKRVQLATIAVMAVAFVNWAVMVQPAEACEPTDGELYWGFPDDGAIVPSDVEFFALYAGAVDDGEVVELVDVAGVVHEVSLSVEPDAHYYAVGLRATPKEPLAAGEYTLTYEPDSEYADVWEVSVVVDEEVATFDELEEVGISWYHQSYGEEVEEFCIPGRGFGSEVHFAFVEHSPAESTRYRLRFEDADGGEYIFNLTADYVAEQDVLSWLLHDGVDCIAVEVVGVNGEVIDSATSCEPDRCVLDEDTEYWISRKNVHPEDWVDVEGCLDEDVGASELGGGAESKEEDSSKSACSSVVEGPLFPSLLVVLAVGLLALRRCRRA